jgi:hypothetical protein
MVSWDTRMLSSSGNSSLSQPDICSGDHSSASLLAPRLRTVRLRASKHALGRSADPHASSSAALARFASTRRLRDFRCLCSDVFALQRAKKCLRFLEADANVAGRTRIAAASNYQY